MLLLNLLLSRVVEGQIRPFIIGQKSMQKNIFKIAGMHCKSCQALIESELIELDGVNEISVDFVKGDAEVILDSKKISLEKIFDEIEKLNYKPYLHDHSSKKSFAGPSVKNNSSFLMGLMVPMVLALLLGGYFLISRIGGFEILSRLNEQNVSYGIILLIGVLAGFHCVGMCGGFVVAYSASSLKEDKKKSLAPHLQYNLGRLISYSVLGALLGGIGSFFAINPFFTGFVIIIAGFFMVLMGMSFLFKWEILKKIKISTPQFIAKYLYRSKKSKGPLAIGLLNGFMPCGPLQSMQLYALTTGSVTGGALSMGIYALGTIPMMFGFGAFVSTLGQKYISRIIKFSGALIIILGLFMANRGLANFGYSIGLGSKVTSEKEFLVSGNIEEFQTVRMDVTYFGYKPNVLYIKKGVPVRWIINAKEITGCTNAIVIESLGIRKDLVPGENIIEFTPKDTGEIKFSCWMRMVWGKFIVTEKDYNPTGIELQNEAKDIPKGDCNGGCGEPTCGAEKGGGCGCGSIRVK